jgi:hypothetical protein
MKANHLLTATLLTVLFLTGCSSTRKPGFPRQSYNEKAQIKALEKEFEKPKLISDYYKLCAKANVTEEEKRAARNRIVDGRIALINLNYNQFVGQFASTKQTIDFSTEIAELGVNLATTVVGGESAKTVLGAVSSGITGAKLAVDKNFFFEKTVPVLVSSMNAQRKESLAPILKGMKQNTDDYPLTQALSDLDGYYFAGTFLGALQTIQAESGAKEEKAQAKINFIRNPDFASESAQVRISALLDKMEKLTDAQALDMEKNPPVADAGLDALIKARDPQGNRATDPKVARQILRMRITMGGKRDEQTLSSWEAAVKSIQ